MKYRKEVLRPGSYHLSDGRQVYFSPNEVEDLHWRLRGMQARGLNVPLAFEHDPQAKPFTTRERLSQGVQSTVGYVESSHIAKNGSLWVVAEIPDREDAKRAEVVRYCSPEIEEEFTDGDGVRWPGKSLTHVAICSTPVQMRQSGFEPIGQSAIRLSLLNRVSADPLYRKATAKKPAPLDRAFRMSQSEVDHVLAELHGDKNPVSTEGVADNLARRIKGLTKEPGNKTALNTALVALQRLDIGKIRRVAVQAGAVGVSGGKADVVEAVRRYVLRHWESREGRRLSLAPRAGGGLTVAEILNVQFAGR